MRQLAPSVLLSSHLPPVRRGIDHSLDSIMAANEAEPVPGPTHDQIASLLHEFGADDHQPAERTTA